MKDWQFCYIIGMIFIAANGGVLFTSLMGIFWLVIAMLAWVVDKLDKE